MHGSASAIVCAIACIALANANSYRIPEPKFKLLKPKGFQVSIPDESGIQLFAFHGNLNKRMESMESGQFSKDTISKQNGKWIYQNSKLKVKSGDVIHYWLFVIKHGVGYRLDDGAYEITDADVKRTAKKSHKVSKRSPDPRSYGIGRRRSPYDWEDAAEDDDEQQPEKLRYGHGYAHHHERDYPRAGNQHRYTSTGYAGDAQHYSHDPHAFDEDTISYHRRPSWGGGDGHHHHHAHHHPHHQWGHKHDDDCDWSAPSPSASFGNDEAPAEDTFGEPGEFLPTAENNSNGPAQIDRDTFTTPPVWTNRPSPRRTTTRFPTTRFPPRTTTDAPKIDLRFGEEKTSTTEPSTTTTTSA